MSSLLFLHLALGDDARRRGGKRDLWGYLENGMVRNDEPKGVGCGDFHGEERELLINSNRFIQVKTILENRNKKAARVRSGFTKLTENFQQP